MDAHSVLEWREGVIPTVPIDLILNVGVGSSIALAGRSTLADRSLLRTPALWALLALELLLFVPVGAYLLVRFPAWSLMYLLDAGSLPVADAWLAATYPMAALSAFVGVRHLLLKQKLWPAVGVIAGSVLLSAAVIWLGREQLLVLGSTQAFRSAPETMRQAIGSELSIVVAAAGIAIGLSWMVTIWRLVVLGNAMKPAAVRNAPTKVRPADAKKAKGTKKVGKKKKAS